MQIGDKDREGNTLILGGWKKDLLLTPEELFLIDNQVTKEEQMALDLYNSYNGTNLTRLPKPRPSELEGVKLPNTSGRVLGVFESESNPGSYHFVIQELSGTIHCTCFGYRAPDHCWHYRSIIEIGPETIPKTRPIVVKLRREEN